MYRANLDAEEALEEATLDLSPHPGPYQPTFGEMRPCQGIQGGRFSVLSKGLADRRGAEEQGCRGAEGVEFCGCWRVFFGLLPRRRRMAMVLTVVGSYGMLESRRVSRLLRSPRRDRGRAAPAVQAW